MRSRPLGNGQAILAEQNNDKRDDARGGGFLLAHQQFGALALGTAPTNGQTVSVVINGTTITATAAATPTNPNDIKNPGTAIGFATNVLNWLRRPDLTNSNQIAASTANQQLLSYVGWAWPGSSTTIVPFSLNKNVNGITGLLTSFNITTTVTSGSWTTQTMQLYVEDGTFYINGIRYLFTGASTPTVTAPVTYPRIDVLTINPSGVLAWTTGTENASPSAPTYPANLLPICELYNVVSEAALFDNEDQQSGEGYISNDVRPTTTAGPNLGAIPDNLIPDATNTRNLGSSGNQWGSIYGQNIYNDGALVAATKFGGTGANGTLSITSGTTTIALGSANYYELNYSSISITGTGALTFSGPSNNGCIVILKSTGNVTLTSSATACIVGDGLGAAAGNDGWALTGYGTKTAINFSVGVFPSGADSPTFEPVSLGAKGAALLSSAFSRLAVFSGSGGQSGGGSNNGAGAPGGIGVAIECGGTLNFTGTISSQGGAEALGTGSSTWSGWVFPSAPGGAGNTDNAGQNYQQINSATYKSGGGGGGGGCVVVLYNFLTANSGTITVSGGAGGTTGMQLSGQSGTAGFSYIGPNTLYP